MNEDHHQIHPSMFYHLLYVFKRLAKDTFLNYNVTILKIFVIQDLADFLFVCGTGKCIYSMICRASALVAFS